MDLRDNPYDDLEGLGAKHDVSVDIGDNYRPDDLELKPAKKVVPPIGGARKKITNMKLGVPSLDLS